MSDDVSGLPSDWQSLLDYYIKLNPHVKKPNPVKRDGHWSGIAGRAERSFIAFDVLRVKRENERVIEEERADFLFSSDCPGVSFVAVASDGHLQADNSAWIPHSPPPSTWSSPVPEYDNAFIKGLF